MPDPATDPQPYDRDAIYDEDGPFNPWFMREAIRTLFRTLPLDPSEPKPWADRRMHAALLGLSALHPRDETEVMLGIQAMAAHHAAMAAWRIGMNLGPLSGANSRHISTACSAARTFDAMLRALERRQAKPLSVPVGRPASQNWDDAPNPSTIVDQAAERCHADANPPQNPPDSAVVWTPDAIAAVNATRERERIEKENEGLDIANTEGILPGGGMILMENPTPQQEAYMDRRLQLGYTREIEENRRKGIFKLPKIRGIRPGDLIP
ncbi:MAG TPA: hypothetical protein VGM42_19175 [Rhodopila sp.]